MALPRNRNDLIRWCLRKLGAPTITINVDETQVEDRVDEALWLYREKHEDGTREKCKVFPVTASCLPVFNSTILGDFEFNEKLIGGLSGASGLFKGHEPDESNVYFIYPQQVYTPFQTGEVVTGEKSGASFTIDPTRNIVLGAMDNGYLELGDEVVAIIDLLKIRSSSNSAPTPFDLEYQLLQTLTIRNFYNLDLLTFTLIQQDIQTWETLFEGKIPWDFDRRGNRLILHTDWRDEFVVGEYIGVHYWEAVDPDGEANEIYSDEWLREYLTALIKMQWGQNISKYGGLQLPGGVTVNGERLINEAREELQKAEEKLMQQYQTPPLFKWG